jgi:hypothetical protein
MTEKKKAWFNSAQMEIHEIGANSKVIVCGRRFGKSDGIIGPDTLYDVQHMPGSSGFIYQATFKQLLRNTLPASEAFWSRYNYKRDFHYVIGRKADKWMKFEDPIIKPMDWSHCIHWYNGTVIHMLSQDVKFSANSLTTDWGKVDEGRSIRKEKMFEEALPTLSGTDLRFSNCYKWKGFTIVSDMPTSKQGQWILDMEKRMDTDLIQAIKDLIAHINYKVCFFNEKGSISRSAQYEIDKLKRELNYYRSKAFLYKEFDTIENVEFLGEDYIRSMKRDLSPVVFKTSILNIKSRKLSDGFYPNIDPDVHYYDSVNNSYIDNTRTNKGSFDIEKISEDNCLSDGDIDSNVPLAITLDYNDKINWIVVGQRVEPEMRTLASFFVKSPQKIRQLCQNWCDYYRFIVNKNVIYYYNETALQKGYADEESESFSEIVIKILAHNGWSVEPVFLGKTWKHMIKHQYIDDAFTGRNYLFPKFNRNNNQFLLPAMEMTGTKIGRTGIEKDKSGEKLRETEDDPYETRTDGTDAWDDLFIGLNFYPRQFTSIPFVTSY